jgi:hypothetical protein
MEDILMKKFYFVVALCSLFFLISGCIDEVGEGDNGNSGQKCSSDADCPLTMKCNTAIGECYTPGSGEGTLPDNNTGGNDGDQNNNDGDNDGTDTDNPGGGCNPGATQKCPYNGPPETEDIGPCKAGVRTCKEDGTWGFCEGEVLPVPELDELCFDGIDNDCSGYIDRGVDWDGDGVPACEDCCEFAHQCPDPKNAWDPEKHFCSFDEAENEKIYMCDDQITPGTKDPWHYAKAIGLCPFATDDPKSGWGVISAEILKPDGSFGAHQNSNGLLTAFGNVIKPQSGGFMLALTSGKIGNPLPEKSFSQGITSNPPNDWYSANGDKYPSSPACSGSTGTTGVTRDPVMLQLRIRTPQSAKSFSFDSYFFTIEYPQYICSQFNDFFIALLDSSYSSSNPEFQNPFDKNLAMDANGNPVGINLAPAGLFKQCVNQPSKGVTSCESTVELKGTGFDDHGGTGWLVTRGNVVGGEVITLRLAIWDLGDHRLDSKVLIDNFRWEFEEFKPGTGEK